MRKLKIIISFISVIFIINNCFANCLTGCTMCKRWSGWCCEICADDYDDESQSYFDPSGGGGGSGGETPSISCNQNACTGTETKWSDGFGDTGAASFGNQICFTRTYQGNTRRYYTTNHSTCKTGYTKTPMSIYGCETTVNVYYKCISNNPTGSTTEPCTEDNCMPDPWTTVTSGTNAVEKRKFRECNTDGTCQELISPQVRCPKNYYGTPRTDYRGNITSYCSPCPSDTATGTKGQTDAPGEASEQINITECYIPALLILEDETGKYVYEQNCYYSN